MNEAPEENLEKKPNIFSKFGGWIKKHKAVTITAAILVVAGIAAAVVLPQLGSAANKDGTTYSFIRTVTLEKGDLDSIVSVTGTVNSANTSNVTYSGSSMSAPKVKTVEVAVGDYVSEGDVIVTLDTADILDSISKEQENIADRKEAAQKSYDKASDAYDDAVYDRNQYEDTRDDAYSAYNSAYKAYKPANDSLVAYQSAYDKAVSARQTAGNTLNTAKLNFETAQAAYTAADSSYQSAYTAALASPTDTALSDALIAAETAKNIAETAKSTAEDKVTAVQKTYDDALAEENAAKAKLAEAQNNSNYALLSQNYQSTKAAYEQADKALQQYEKAVDSAREAKDTAKDNLDDVGSSDTLEDLYEQLEDCQLKAETSGKVTSLSAEVGSTPVGTVATIQDVEDLEIAVTIEEADINSVSIGMPCRITSDATGTTVISGTLTQIDPVANQSGTFGAEVTVEGDFSGLLVGMNASVDIVLSSTADCFTVPIDALGNDGDGKGDYIYRKTGGEGVNLTFEKIYVTTGKSNDYYIEISSAMLSSGDVIRASSDLTQGIETVDTQDNLEYMMEMRSEAMNGGMGGDAYVDGGMPAGGGEMPDGGFGGM